MFSIKFQKFRIGKENLFQKIYLIFRRKPYLQGPYYLHTSADDKYSNDACAIICFKTTPPVLALSTCTGTIYHGMLLTPDEESEYSGKGVSKNVENIFLHDNNN